VPPDSTVDASVTSDTAVAALALSKRVGMCCGRINVRWLDALDTLDLDSFLEAVDAVAADADREILEDSRDLGLSS